MSIADRRVDPARPAERRRRLDRDLRHVRRQHRRRGTRRPAASKSSQLGIETTRAWTPFSASRSLGAERRPDLGAGRDEHHVGRVDVGEHVGAAAQARGGARARCGRSSGTFWRESDEAARAPAILEDPAPTPRTHSFASAGRITVSFGIARIAARCSTGWWVGPSSPTATESWREDPDDVELHQRREPDRRAHVVGEDEERRAERLHDPAVQREPVHRGAHAVLADAPGDVAAGVLGREVRARPRTA